MISPTNGKRQAGDLQDRNWGLCFHPGPLSPPITRNKSFASLSEPPEALSEAKFIFQVNRKN
jgi:hypothetical protein